MNNNNGQSDLETVILKCLHVKLKYAETGQSKYSDSPLCLDSQSQLEIVVFNKVFSSKYYGKLNSESQLETAILNKVSSS